MHGRVLFWEVQMAFAGTSGGVPFVRVPPARSNFFFSFLAKIGGWGGRSADDRYGDASYQGSRSPPVQRLGVE